MTHFCRLADPKQYVACKWDLSADAAARTYWIEFFKKQMNTAVAVGVAAARGESRESAHERAEGFRKAFAGRLGAFDERPDEFGRVTILTFDAWRDLFLREAGFRDPFVDLKNRENAKVLPMLPEVCGQLDRLRGQEQVCAVVEGVFAGNIYDMGVEATAKAFKDKGPDFFQVRSRLSPRPWLVDDFDELTDRLLGEAYHKAVIFIDNAGSDLVLGVVPLARWLAKRGTRVVLAANERPTLNDMSIGDLRSWWPRIVEAEPSLRGLPIELSGTGTGEPLIDLSSVSDELNELSADADFVVLEGMGRGVESNTDVALNCDSLNIAMIKDGWVAAELGGKAFDLVCRFRRGSAN